MPGKKILWMTWKDIKHPLAGGAELVTSHLAKRLVKDGNEVVILTSGFKKAKGEEMIDGYKVIRVGSRYSVYLKAFLYYTKHLRGWADLVVDEMNTMPFFAKFYVSEKNIFFVHMLCRNIWFYQMMSPVNFLGYILEMFYLPLFTDRKVVTVSESTKQDLIRFGFDAKNIAIISEGIEIEHLKDIDSVPKFEKPTMLALGAIRSMKRTDHIIKAFEIAKTAVPNLELLLCGSAEGSYGQKVLSMIKGSKFKKSIKYLGRVGNDQKIKLLQRSHFVCVTSVKEGWCLVVSEANSQGTPAVVYDVDGLRDSVKDNVTGFICYSNQPIELAKNIVRILEDKRVYKYLQKNAWDWSKDINFENSYRQFKKVSNFV